MTMAGRERSSRDERSALSTLWGVSDESALAATKVLEFHSSVGLSLQAQALAIEELLPGGRDFAIFLMGMFANGIDRTKQRTARRLRLAQLRRASKEAPPVRAGGASSRPADYAADSLVQETIRGSVGGLGKPCAVLSVATDSGSATRCP